MSWNKDYLQVEFTQVFKATFVSKFNQTCNALQYKGELNEKKKKFKIIHKIVCAFI